MANNDRPMPTTVSGVVNHGYQLHAENQFPAPAMNRSSYDGTREYVDGRDSPPGYVEFDEEQYNSKLTTKMIQKEKDEPDSMHGGHPSDSRGRSRQVQIQQDPPPYVVPAWNQVNTNNGQTALTAHQQYQQTEQRNYLHPQAATGGWNPGAIYPQQYYPSNGSSGQSTSNEMRRTEFVNPHQNAMTADANVTGVGSMQPQRSQVIIVPQQQPISFWRSRAGYRCGIIIAIVAIKIILLVIGLGVYLSTSWDE